LPFLLLVWQKPPWLIIPGRGKKIGKEIECLACEEFGKFLRVLDSHSFFHRPVILVLLVPEGKGEAAVRRAHLYPAILAHRWQ
jgi:hypothetical protein